MRFKHCTSIFSLFFKNSNIGLLFILVFADDILVRGDDSSKVLRIIESLKVDFKLKHMGVVHYFLGIVKSLHKGLILFYLSKNIVMIFCKKLTWMQEIRVILLWHHVPNTPILRGQV